MLCRNDRSQISYTHYLQDTPVVVVYITTVCTRHDREKPSSSLEKISSVQPSNSHTTHINIHITSHHITPSSLPRTELSNSNWPTLIEQSTIPYRARPRVLASWLPGSLLRQVSEFERAEVSISLNSAPQHFLQKTKRAKIGPVQNLLLIYSALHISIYLVVKPYATQSQRVPTYLLFWIPTISKYGT